MYSFERFNESVRKLRKYFQLIGQDIFALSNDFHCGRFLFIGLGILTLGAMNNAINIYTMHNLNWSIRLLNICSVVAVLLVIIKYLLLINLRPLCQTVIPHFESIYRENQKFNNKYFAICQKFARYNEMFLNVCAICLIVTYSIIIILTLLHSFMTMTPFYYTYFPMVYEYSLMQLILINLFGICLAVVVFLVAPPGDVLIAFVVLNLAMISKLIAFEINELSVHLQRRHANVAEIKRHWLTYIQYHQKINECVEQPISNKIEFYD